MNKPIPIYVSDMYKLFRDTPKGFMRRKIRNKEFLITGYEVNYVDETIALRITMPFKTATKGTEQ